MSNIKVASLEELLARKRAAAAAVPENASPSKLARLSESGSRGAHSLPAASAAAGARPSSLPAAAKDGSSPSNAGPPASTDGLAAVLSATRQGNLERLRAVLSDHSSVRLADADTDGYSVLHALVQYNFPQVS